MISKATVERVKGIRVPGKNFYQNLLKTVGITVIYIIMRIWNLLSGNFKQDIFLFIFFAIWGILQCVRNKYIIAVFGQHRLYFYDAVLTEQKSKTLCKKITKPFNGSIAYGDMKRAELTSGGVIIHGKDFRIEVTGVGKGFIKKAEAMRRKTKFDRDEKVPDDVYTAWRGGVWGETWTACENGEFDRAFKGELIIKDFELNENSNAISLSASKNRHEFGIFIDNERVSVITYNGEPQDGDTRGMECFADVNDVFSYIRERIDRF